MTLNAPPAKVLVVDDQPASSAMLEALFGSYGWEIRSAATIDQARRLVAQQPIDLAIVDETLPDGRGLALASELRRRDCEVIIMSEPGSINSAIRAAEADTLSKPLVCTHAVRQCVERAYQALRLRRQNRELVHELQAMSAELEALVVRDPLTGLFNHAFFQDVLEREITLNRRHRSAMSLVFIDVDRFKHVNDAHGHKAGDALLKRLADIVRGEIRTTDIPFHLRRGDFAARFGADRIALVLPHTDKSGSAYKAESLRAAVVNHGFADLGLGGQVTVSIGVATCPGDASTRPDLISAAELALAAAKQGGRNCIWSFTPMLLANGSLKQVELARRQALISSIAQGGFDHYFQPIFDVETGGLFGYEALVRPHQDAFPGPGELLATAESIGRVSDLGRALRRAALQSITELPSPFVLFVNLHPHELNDPRLATMDDAVDRHRDRIVFEVTEVSPLPDYDNLARQLGPLRERGYRVALDDLGAEYSGLQALAQLGPDFIKLDNFLARHVRSDTRTRRLVRHLVDFATEEGIAVVAEGIETAEERDVMRELGCNLMQGFLFGKPGPGFGPTP